MINELRLCLVFFHLCGFCFVVVSVAAGIQEPGKDEGGRQELEKILRRPGPSPSGGGKGGLDFLVFAHDQEAKHDPEEGDENAQSGEALRGKSQVCGPDENA